MPPAATVSVAVWPAAIVCSSGCVEIVGAVAEAPGGGALGPVGAFDPHADTAAASVRATATRHRPRLTDPEGVRLGSLPSWATGLLRAEGVAFNSLTLPSLFNARITLVAQGCPGACLTELPDKVTAAHKSLRV